MASSDLVALLLAFAFAAASTTALLVSVRRDPRRLRCGILLLITVSALAILLHVLGNQLNPIAGAIGTFITGLVVLAVTLALLALPVLLIVDGIVTLVHEGPRSRPGLLALGTGLLIMALPFVAGYLIELGSAWSGTVAVLLLFLGLYLGGFLVVLGAQWVVRRVFGGRQKVPDPDVLLVLGSGLIGGKVPPLLATRLDRARELAAEEAVDGRAPLFLVSGGQGEDEPRSEAAAMAEYLRDHGVAPERILVEDASRNTRENLVNSTALLRERRIEGPVLAVTSSYHATRTDVLAADLGLGSIHVVGAPTAWFYAPGAFIREYLAILTYRWPLNICVAVASVLIIVILRFAT
ncbi:Uncharacterized SAM-binding protein YcdF, DUF218 family [Propionibacterium cyclohexanicum]|uniref:Uncharacterized SAM-binding protein YcdF, DUF218 family n=1 Tax=Propionibacterium cyclohexanicum TaxID=64702 RepID=A0A1H9RK48_9ACTN|nr:YdcF family protein [Propionibacterium cyclohexanicum]SER72319.1 Uncharacterized SAM-binding protein YcdF, DUF218 family [Propionibacterium cyclohexanicum]